MARAAIDIPADYREGVRRGRSLFALANREINLRLDEVYRGLAPFSMGRFGETTARQDEVV